MKLEIYIQHIYEQFTITITCCLDITKERFETLICGSS